MPTQFTLHVDLVNPVLIKDGHDLAGLHSGEISRVRLRIQAEMAPVVDLDFDYQTTQMMDLIECLQAIQPNGTNVTLYYRGREESITL